MRGSGRFPARVSMALAGLVLTVAGCSQALPLGPAPAPLPVPSHLASAIVLQPGLSDPGASVSKCPAGSVALSGPGAVDGSARRHRPRSVPPALRPASASGRWASRSRSPRPGSP